MSCNIRPGFLSAGWVARARDEARDAGSDVCTPQASRVSGVLVVQKRGRVGEMFVVNFSS